MSVSLKDAGMSSSSTKSGTSSLVGIFEEVCVMSRTLGGRKGQSSEAR